MVRAIPVDKSVTAHKAEAASPQRGRGRPLKNTAATDGSITAAQTGLIFPPPPPPPPPPTNNPYYQRFVEQYWQNYDGNYNSLPHMPTGIPLMPPQAVASSCKKREVAALHLPPLTLSQEFPINSDRTTYFIGDPVADTHVLSQKSCYIRTRLFELFTTLPTDDIHWKVKGNRDSKTIAGRIGLRCVYCAFLPHKSRAERSVCYPSSVARLYHTVADMQHKHLDACSSVPLQIRRTIHRLSSSAPRRENHMPPKTYWEVNAIELGMEDIEGVKNGIRLREDHKFIAKNVDVVDGMFVAMGEKEEEKEERRKRKAGPKHYPGGDGVVEGSEKKHEKADQEAEELLVHL